MSEFNKDDYLNDLPDPDQAAQASSGADASAESLRPTRYVKPVKHGKIDDVKTFTHTRTLRHVNSENLERIVKNAKP